ncbi:MAG TPA: glycosyltransferase [Gaiellaceae bacterium]|jgi:glycosyltransferase involved in cell wall biosynthesis|nr:glycosyltransferase [Gaiellaceae bacterium]
MPLVSHILPVWNPRPEWLLPAVRSVLGQVDCELELVIVDDGSDVPVGHLLTGLADERLRLLRIEHGGVSHARNAGLANAHGEYVRFVDADDVLPADSTSRLLSLAAGSRVVTYGSTTFCDDALRPVWTLRCRVEGNAVEACLLGRFSVRVVSMLFPRAVVDAVGRWNPLFRVSGDWDYVLRTLEAAPVRGTESTMAFYRKHDGSVTDDFGGGEAGGRLVLDQYFRRHPELRGTRLERRARAALEATAARTLLSRRRIGDGVTAALRATVRDPASIAAEARRSVPALAGHVRSRLDPRPPIAVAP